MPHVTISDDLNIIATFMFKQHFSVAVCEQEKLIFWNDETGWQNPPSQQKAYHEAVHPVIHLWMPGSVASNRYMVQFVRPDWQLSILDTACPVGFYAPFFIDWAEVRLVYRPFAFAFNFSDLNGLKNTAPPHPETYKGNHVG